MKTINVLWTGGWDSTFRIIQLSTKNVIIQPYYLVGSRENGQIELDTIVQLSEDIRARKLTRCILKELITINISSLEPNSTITKSYNKIKQKFGEDTHQNLGSQYGWLARFAKSLGTLDLSIEKDTKPIVAIEQYGALEKVLDLEIGDYFVVDKSRSPQYIIDVFRYYRFPLVEYSKLVMKQEAEENGFIKIMNKTWFCHEPIDQKACGTCSPCMATMEEGFEYRFTPIAIKRYKRKKLLKPITNTLFYKAFRKINRVLKG